MNDDVTEKGAKLVKWLKQRIDDRGLMADLRRGFNPDTEHKAWPYVADWCDLTRSRQRHVHMTVMAAFAYHPRHDESAGNLGRTLRKIAMVEGGKDGLASFETRFRRLLVCDSLEELCRLLGPVIRAAAAKGVTINYVELFKDLTYWSSPVKLRWASGYWSSGKTDQGEEAA